MTVKRRITASLLWLSMLPGTAVLAASEPMGRVLDSRTMYIQEKAETLYAKGDYRRAHFIYKSELASVGDKYAQYMTGYMYLTGAGVDADPARAAAWYRLAAERGKPEYVAVRDELFASLDAGARDRALAHYDEIKREYSDVAVAFRSVIESAAKLRRLEEAPNPEPGMPLSVVGKPAPGSAAGQESSRHRHLRQRYEGSLEFLGRQLALPELAATPPAELDGAALGEQVDVYMEQAD